MDTDPDDDERTKTSDQGAAVHARTAPASRVAGAPMLLASLMQANPLAALSVSPAAVSKLRSILEDDKDEAQVHECVVPVAHHFLHQNAIAVLVRSIISGERGEKYTEAQANTDHTLYWLTRNNGVSKL